MSLTGITWLTGEVIDQTRLNGQVANTTYLKTLYSTIDPYSGTVWSATSWSAVSAWATGQIIDESRLNQMFTNQFALRAVVDVHLIWDYPDEHFWAMTRDEPLPRNGTYVRPDEICLIDYAGSKLGSVLKFPLNDGVWNTMKVSNINIEHLPTYEIIKLGFWFGDQTNYMCRFTRHPEMKYLSLWIDVAKTNGQNTWNWKNLIVRAHREYTSW